jgi:hypothetical protein
MNDLLKRPGYRLYVPTSPRGRELLAGHGLTSADLEQVLLRHHEATGTRIDTILGLNEDGVFGITDEAAAPRQMVVPLLWLQLLELLGPCPRAARRGSLRTASCPDRPGIPHLRRRGLAPGGDLFVARVSMAEPAKATLKQHRMRARRSELLYGRDHRRLRWPIAPIWSRWLFAWSRAATTASCAASR